MSRTGKSSLPHVTLTRARRLRQEMTDAEKILWRHLRSNQLGGIKFRRQHPIPPWIVDFCCIEKKLVIELDGGQHTHETDAFRTQQIEAQGWMIVRYWNHDVLTQTEAVIADIWEKAKTDISFSRKE